VRLMSLSIGILIIGSLYWDPERRAWRDSRLRMDEVQTVRAPIRYGRLSRNRGNTYTMVFSRLCELGHAKVVRCRADVSTADDLITEAEHPWAAERNVETDGQISATWGRVALLSNPIREVPKDVLEAWAERVSRERGYGDVPQAPGEGPLVSSRGVLQMPWSAMVNSDEALPLDLLLTTANRPSFVGDPPQYPDPRRIADAWRQDKVGNVSYFRNNQRDGICTFQDDAISRLLQNGHVGIALRIQARMLELVHAMAHRLSEGRRQP
jgi:hypothetical protein